MKRILTSLLSLALITPMAMAQNNSIGLIIDPSYSSEDVPDVLNGQNWTAIVPSEGSLVAKQITLTVTERPNQPNDIEPAGRTKDITFPRDAIVLFHGLNIPEGSRFKAHDFDYHALAAGRSIILQGREKSVALTARGQSVDSTNTKDYSLSATVNGKESVLVEGACTDDTLPYLIFAGDLNGDDYPDFVIDLSLRYAQQILTLFLSGQNTQGEVAYTKAAERITSSC